MKTSRLILLGFTVLVVTGLWTLSASAQLGKGFITIDPPGAGFAIGFGINDHGDVVGTFYDSGGLGHGFFRDEGGRFTTIDHPQAQTVNGFGTEARGINTAGQIVGDFCAAPPCDGVSVIKGYVLKRDADRGFDRDDFKTLQTPHHANSYLESINSEGDMAGCEHDTDTMGTMHGIIWDDGKVIRFPVRASMNNGINDQGEVAGFYTDLSTGREHAYLLGKSGGKHIDFPGAVNTVAWGINNRSQVVGGYKKNGVTHGFFWHESKFTTVDIPGAVMTIVFGINSEGDLVGLYATPTAGHAFLLRRKDERP